jgi:AcrR family transcriptional regulator
MHGGEAVMKGDFQRWTAKRKAELVLEILRGDLSVAQACKRFDLDESNLQSWIDTFLQTGERSLKSAKHRGAVEGQAAAEQRPAKTKQTSQALRKEPKSRTSREIVESIQQACIRILEREGVDALTTNRIAEVAGVSVGSLYQYYPNKEAIVESLYQEALERDLSASTMNAFRARVKASISERSFRETLADFFEAVIDRHRRMLRLAPSHYLENLREYDLDKFIKERYRARLTTEVWLEYLVGLYSDRIGESGDFELKSFVAMRGVIGALNAVVEDRPELLESPMLRDELVELVLRYFAYEEDASD